MLAITQEWVDKAEEDWDVAGLAMRARKSRNYNAVCFHAQQCAENYLKSRIQEEGLAVSKTHDLEKLLDLLLPAEPLWLNSLTTQFLSYRYPGDAADKAEAREAMKLCLTVCETVRVGLGLLP